MPADWGLYGSLRYKNDFAQKRADDETSIRNAQHLRAIEQKQADDEMKARAEIAKTFEEFKKLPFLEPDVNKLKDRINTEMQTIVDGVKKYGGNAKKYLAGGGYQDIQKFKSNVYNSEEMIGAEKRKANLFSLQKAKERGDYIYGNPEQEFNAFHEGTADDFKFEGSEKKIDVADVTLKAAKSLPQDFDLLKPTGRDQFGNATYEKRGEVIKKTSYDVASTMWDASRQIQDAFPDKSSYQRYLHEQTEKTLQPFIKSDPVATGERKKEPLVYDRWDTLDRIFNGDETAAAFLTTMTDPKTKKTVDKVTFDTSGLNTIIELRDKNGNVIAEYNAGEGEKAKVALNTLINENVAQEKRVYNEDLQKIGRRTVYPAGKATPQAQEKAQNIATTLQKTFDGGSTAESNKAISELKKSNTNIKDVKLTKGSLGSNSVASVIFKDGTTKEIDLTKEESYQELFDLANPESKEPTKSNKADELRNKYNY